MKKIIVFILIIFLIITSCKNEVENSKDSCSSDNNCIIGGCSGQLCGSKEELQDVITTCEWREEYSCYKLTSCSCINNKCQWKETNEFKDCLKNNQKF